MTAYDELMIRETIVVEGKDDIEAVKRAVQAVCIATHGHGFGEKLLDELAEVNCRCGIIILTDPDYAGKKIRRRIAERIPDAKHAFIQRDDASRGGDVGVENASPEAIRQALMRAHAEMIRPIETFSREDMLDFGLEGQPESKRRRIALTSALGIGYGNAKQLLAKLNAYGITREELERAMAEPDERVE